MARLSRRHAARIESRTAKAVAVAAEALAPLGALPAVSLPALQTRIVRPDALVAIAASR
jgi:hypothetical protein